MKKVLVVEDSATARAFYRSTLESAGFAVDEAANGLEGLERVLLERYDLAIVDINMPKMDGYAMTRELRENPNFFGLPVVMVTTEAGERDEAKAFDCGANYYIVKPADPAALTLTARLLTGSRP